MRRHCRFAIMICALALSTPTGRVAGAQDIAGAKDHPMFSRMPSFAITEHETKDFDRHEFKDSSGNEVTVEGRKTVIQYEVKPGVRPPSALQITRNFVNAVKKIGGSAYEYTEGTAFLSHKKDGKEVARLVGAKPAHQFHSFFQSLAEGKPIKAAKMSILSGLLRVIGSVAFLYLGWQGDDPIFYALGALLLISFAFSLYTNRK